MSWHYLPEQAAGSSGDCCTGGEPLPPLKSKTTHAEFYCNGRLTESYLDSLSGMMSAPSTESPGEERLTLSQEDFHARTSAQQGRAQASTENDPDCGQRWHGLSVRYDRDSSSWKTHRCLWEEALPWSSVTLPAWGMMRDGECWELIPSARPTSETGSGFWPTPTWRDWRSGKASQETMERNARPLNDVVCGGGIETRRMWPTPNKMDACKFKIEETPEEWERQRAKHALKGVNKQKPLGVATKERGGSGHLNPDWVEWLMGWSPGWTDLKPLAMDRFRRWLRLHGLC